MSVFLPHANSPRPQWLIREAQHISTALPGFPVAIIFADDLPGAEETAQFYENALQGKSNNPDLVNAVYQSRAIGLHKLLGAIPEFTAHASFITERMIESKNIFNLQGMVVTNQLIGISRGRQHRPAGYTTVTNVPPTYAAIMLPPQQWSYAHYFSYLVGWPLAQAHTLSDAKTMPHPSSLWHELGHIETALNPDIKRILGWQDELMADERSTLHHHTQLNQPQASLRGHFRQLVNFTESLDREAPRYWNTLTHDRITPNNSPGYWRDMAATAELKVTAARLAFNLASHLIPTANTDAGLLMQTMHSRRFAPVRRALAADQPGLPERKLQLMATLPALARYDGFTRPETAELARRTRDAAYILMPKLMHRLQA